MKIGNVNILIVANANRNLSTILLNILGILIVCHVAGSLGRLKLSKISDDTVSVVCCYTEANIIIRIITTSWITVCEYCSHRRAIATRVRTFIRAARCHQNDTKQKRS